MKRTLDSRLMNCTSRVNNVIYHIYSTGKAFTAFMGLALIISLVLPLPSLAASINLATAPLANATTTSVLPNVMFILDDSGSMDWDYLPDWANDSLCRSTTGTYNASCTNQPPYRSSDYNGIYYNPAIYYKPPVNADGTSKASQTTWTSVKTDAYNIQNTGSTNLVTSYIDVEWCTDSNYTDCLRNDNYILPGTVNGKSYTTSRPSVTSTGTGSVATGSVSAPTTAIRSWVPHYYTIIPGEYCDSAQLTNCSTTATPTGAFIYPAKVRWCNTTALTTCQGLRAGAYTNPRYPSMVTRTSATITVSSGTTTSVNSITVNGLQILSVATSDSNNSGTVASRISANINNCTGSTSGNCTIAGYSASRSGSVVTIFAPASLGAITFSPVVTKASGSMTLTATAFSGGGTIPGSFQRTDIVSGSSYPFPGSATKASARTDCVGTTCTYAEEMTNFANWWT